MQKHLYIIIAFIVLIVVFVLNSFIKIPLTYNQFPMLINMGLLFVFIIVYLALFKKIKIKNIRVLSFLFSVLIFQNLLFSFIDSFFEKDLSNDLSFVISLPLLIIFVILWGYFFDKLENVIHKGKANR